MDLLFFSLLLIYIFFIPKSYKNCLHILLYVPPYHKRISTNIPWLYVRKHIRITRTSFLYPSHTSCTMRDTLPQLPQGHNGIPFRCANMKSSKPICPPKSLVISTLCVLSVQNRICKEGKATVSFVSTA